jgi:hypothetical protein
VSHDLLIFRLEGIHRINMPVGDDQDMGWRDRVNVPESSHLFVAIYNGPFGFIRHDLAK